MAVQDVIHLLPPFAVAARELTPRENEYTGVDAVSNVASRVNRRRGKNRSDERGLILSEDCGCEAV
jgi:hypothetical protein